MKKTLYIYPLEFQHPYWNDSQMLGSIQVPFTKKYHNQPYISNLSLVRICSSKIYSNHKLVILLPMPLDSTNLLGEFSHKTSDENKIHTKIWFILLEICLKICKKRPDTLIVTGCDWDEHNLSNFNGKSVISLILEKFREKNINLYHLVWLYNNPFVPDWLNEQTKEDCTKVFSLYYSSYLYRCMNIINNIYRPDFTTVKDKWFLCLNRIGKGHRINIAYWWYKNGIKPSYFSYRITRDDKSNIDRFLTIEGYNQINSEFHNNELNEIEKYQDFANTLPWVLDTPAGNKEISISYQDHLPAQYIKSVACYIPTETYFGDGENNKGFITEKTLKCFAYGLPAIWIAPAHTLEAIKKIGFKSFDLFIDESYDTEDNIHKRMNLAVSEINRIQHIENIDFWYKQGIEIYKHNFDNLIKLANRDLPKIVEDYHISLLSSL